LTHLENVISTGATDGFIVRRAVEKPALSEVEWDPRISLLYLLLPLLSPLRLLLPSPLPLELLLLFLLPLPLFLLLLLR
jgi:hypothetical protein